MLPDARLGFSLRLRLEETHFRSIERREIRSLRGFDRKRGHTVPDRPSSSADSWIKRLLKEELHSEIQCIYVGCKDLLGLRRSQIQKEVGDGVGSVDTDLFRFSVVTSQDKEQPHLAQLVRHLNLKKPDSEIPDALFEIFPSNPEEIVIPTAGPLDFDTLVERFEDLVGTRGGTLAEDDRTGTITLKTIEGITIEVSTVSGEFIIRPKAGMSCKGLLSLALSIFRSD